MNDIALLKIIIQTTKTLVNISFAAHTARFLHIFAYGLAVVSKML